MKAHIRACSESGLVHSVAASVALANNTGNGYAVCPVESLDDAATFAGRRRERRE